ncbi:10835_t:CDS:10, partial [Dentiscutata erythropus]
GTPQIFSRAHPNARIMKTIEIVCHIEDSKPTSPRFVPCITTEDRFENAVMEWTSIQELISSWKQHVLHESFYYGGCTADILKNIDIVVDFLNVFHEQQLVGCKTAQECVTKFPKGGQLLTDLAKNRILVLHSETCRLVVKCILEYSKCVSEFPDSLTNSNYQSKNWCLNKIKSLFFRHNPSYNRDNASECIARSCGAGNYELQKIIVTESVTVIREFLETIITNSIVMPSQYFVKISEQFLPLLDESSMWEMADLIIRSATSRALNVTSYTDNCEVLSCKFVEKLVFSESIFDRLSIEAKSGHVMLVFFQARLKFISPPSQVMKLFGHLLFSREKEYMAPREIKEAVRNELLFQRMIIHPRICHLCFDILTKLVIESPDWRILRLVRYIIQPIFESDFRNGYSSLAEYLPQPFADLVSNLTNYISGAHDFSMINSCIKQFLLSQGLSDVRMCRKQVWILLMSFPKWHYWIIEVIFDELLFPEISELEEPIRYLAWLVCPRDDNTIITLTNTIVDIIISVRECLSVSQHRNEKILSCLERYQPIFTNQMILVDIILGLWPVTNSLDLMKKLVRFSRKNDGVNLTTLTLILDYFYETQVTENDSEMKDFLNNLQGIYKNSLSSHIDSQPENRYSSLVHGQRIVIIPEFTLESGYTLHRVPVAYKTWGKLNVDRNNVMVICHALTGSADVQDWWGPLIGKGRAFDPTKYFIFCGNVLGSPYGTASPVTINPDTGSIYGPEFPLTTPRDDIATCLGGSMGGMQVLEWLFFGPEYVKTIIPIATSARHSAWCISWNEAQRQSIYSDQKYYDGFYQLKNEQPTTGLAAARMSALLTYRSRNSFESRFGRKYQDINKYPTDDDSPFAKPKTPAENALSLHNDGLRSNNINDKPFKSMDQNDNNNIFLKQTNNQDNDIVESLDNGGYIQENNNEHSTAAVPHVFSAQSYLRYQGDKFVKRFDANCYISLTRKMDAHDITKGRGDLREVLSSIKQPACIIGIESDGLFTISEQYELAEFIPNSEMITIKSPDGHDGFLLEFDQINRHILRFTRAYLSGLFEGESGENGVQENNIDEKLVATKSSLFGEAEVDDMMKW